MEEIIIFETTVKSPSELAVISSNGSEWIVDEKWCIENEDLVHDITLQQQDKLFYEHYYVEVEACLVPCVENDLRMLNPVTKSFKVCLEKIHFNLHEKEYNMLIVNTDENLLSKTIRIKIVLSPILQLINKPKFPIVKSRKKKPTLGHIIEDLKNLSFEINSLVNDECSIAADVILYCGSQRVEAHRAVLSARSPRFLQLFHKLIKQQESAKTFPPSPVKLRNELEGRRHIPSITELEDVINENKHPTFVFNPLPNTEMFCEIVLDDVHESVFKDFIDYIYGGMFKRYTFENAKNLYYAAVFKYKMNDFKAKCLLLFRQIINNENASELIEFARNLEDENLKDVWSDYNKHQENEIEIQNEEIEDNLVIEMENLVIGAEDEVAGIENELAGVENIIVGAENLEVRVEK